MFPKDLGARALSIGKPMILEAAGLQNRLRPSLRLGPISTPKCFRTQGNQRVPMIFGVQPAGVGRPAQIFSAGLEINHLIQELVDTVFPAGGEKRFIQHSIDKSIYWVYQLPIWNLPVTQMNPFIGQKWIHLLIKNGSIYWSKMDPFICQK